MDAVEKHWPRKRVPVPFRKPFIQDNLVTQTRCSKRRAYKKNCPSWKTFGKLLKQKLSQLSNQLSKNKCEAVDNVRLGSAQWWSKVKQITGQHPGKFHGVSQININKRWMDSQQFADRLNQFLSDSVGDTFNLRVIDDSIITPLYALSPSSVITVSTWEVCHLLRTINPRKASHFGDFPSWVSKKNAALLAEPVAHIINSVGWKKAEIRPLSKVDNPTDLKDFRPISLLYHLSKVAEKCVNSFLTKAVNSKLEKNQYA